ncbi:uncharacterized protein PRCAT00003711001 [Priceomyces carsonii]|uniref:uncharacterized protein n=1 Tax=Priceomyces carsonii TaxID=28549 RepID=UPI002ED9387B|nr:unnamed protein product [Priceomyces carsonii]
MKSFLRAIVSSPNQSFYDEQSNKNFDLSYITPQLIVCSGPVNHYVKSFYRYPINELVKFLDSRHGPESNGDWHIWNFRGEGIGYIKQDVRNKISYYPFPDHQVPTIKLLLHCVREIYGFLSKSPDNVAVLHCKAGKGRSGTICCAYLMYQSVLHDDNVTPESANHLFTEKRMKQFGGKGVSIISQLRYLKYWDDFIHFNEDNEQRFFDFNPSTGELSVPFECRLTMIKIKNASDALLKSKVSNLNLRLETYSELKADCYGLELKEFINLSNKTNVIVKGSDLTLLPSIALTINKNNNDIRISIKDWCYSWFNVYFETLNTMNMSDSLSPESRSDSSEEKKAIQGSYLATWDSLDGFKGSYQRGCRLFDSVEVCWVFNY